MTAAVWIASLASLAAGGAVAALFVSMPFALDPLETITAGTDPWSNAVVAAAAFIGLVVWSALGLRLWHSRFRPLGLLVTVAELAAVGWICMKVYADYF